MKKFLSIGITCLLLVGCFSPRNGSVVTKIERGTEKYIVRVYDEYYASYANIFIPKNYEGSLPKVGEKLIFTTETKEPIYVVFRVESSKTDLNLNVYSILGNVNDIIYFRDKPFAFQINDKIGF